MSLFELPPEIIVYIFEYVGSSYFRSDLSRITVCRLWSRYAHTACFQDLSLTRQTLRNLDSSPDKGAILTLVKDSLKTLSLFLEGYQGWNLFPVASYEHKRVLWRYWRGPHGMEERQIWTRELDLNLLFLITIMKDSRKLRSLCIKTISELHPHVPMLGRRDYLYLSTVRACISTCGLSHLELDLVGTNLLPKEHDEEDHICPSIAKLLPTLRRLRLRMRSICADVLKSPQGSTDLRLNLVLINLSLTNESPLVAAAGHAIGCNSSPVQFLRLQFDIEKEAQVLVTQMAAPKMVRILSHARTIHTGLQALDVLSGETIKLDEKAEWDDPGEVVEEIMDEESEISNLSSSDQEGS